MKIYKNQYVLRILGLLGLDVLLFSLTNAQSVASFVVGIGFVLLVLTVYYLFYGLLGFISLYGLSIKRKKSAALYMTGTAALLIALQSVGELGSRDFLVMLPLVVLGYLYSAYVKTSRRDLSS